ncbi:unnamed protein product, partial [Discosporangium mesarthrocarpum]
LLFCHLRRCEAGLRASVLRQIEELVYRVKRHINPYLPRIIDLTITYW